MRINFEVQGLPPMKDGANSMWCHQPGIDRLIALRRAAVAAFEQAGALPFNEPIRVTLEVRGVLMLDRSIGDLDNFITGVLDGLQKAAAGTPWPNRVEWAAVEESVRPGRDVGLVDDSLVVEIVACKMRGAAGDGPVYSVRLEAVEAW